MYGLLAGMDWDGLGWVLLCVYAAVLASLEVHDACADELFLACACLALAVEVPDWLGEGL